MFFRNRKKKLLARIEMLKTLLQLLPADMGYLSDQVDEGIIIGCIEGSQGPEGSVFWEIVHDKVIREKYKRSRDPWMTIKGLKVVNANTQQEQAINLHVHHGILSSYYFPGAKDVNTVAGKASGSYSVELIGNIDFEKIRTVLTKKEEALLDPEQVYIIELNGKEIFHLIDLEDGDFFGMDANRNFYHVTHDPFEMISVAEGWDFLERYGK